MNKKAQSTLEYAVLIFVVVAALIAMQIYFKRSVQGRIRASTDDIGEQYSPGITTSDYTTVRDTTTLDQMGADFDDDGTRDAGVTQRDFEQDHTVRTGEELVPKLADESGL